MQSVQNKNDCVELLVSSITKYISILLSYDLNSN